MLEKHLEAQAFDIESTKAAGFWIRFAASLIDFLVLAILIIGSQFMKSVPGYLLLVIPTLFYKPILEGLLGGTAGKLALGLKVINQNGQLLGLSGAFIRAGIFILPSIPSIMLRSKQIEQGISPWDPAAVQAFNADNMLLNYAGIGLTVVWLISCIFVAFTAHKRGLHDFVADSYVIYKDQDAGKHDG